MASNKLVALACAACLMALGVMIALVLRIESLAHAGDRVQELPIAISSQRLDFGEVPLHGSVSRELIVRNDSGAAVRARISVDGTNFTASPEKLVLQPGIEFRISVVATLDEPGSLDDEMLILFEDWDVAPVVIALAAQSDGSFTDPEMAERKE